MFGKAESETMPFGKELEVPTPRETPDDHGATAGGTSQEGPPMDGPHKAIRRQRTGKAGEKASCGKRAISEKQPISHIMGCSGPENCLRKMDHWHDITMMSQRPLAR